MMDEYPAVIIGAGLTGLSCAYHLGADYLLIEKEPEPGGIVRTRIRETPYGPFLLRWHRPLATSPQPDIRALVERAATGGLCEYERRAVIHLEGSSRRIRFKLTRHGLPRQVVLDCVLGLLKARYPEEFGLPRRSARPAHFLDSSRAPFGEGICRLFMVPIQRKASRREAWEIAADYADRFIPQPSLEDIVKGALGFSREALGVQRKVRVSREGGIGAFSRAWRLPSSPPRCNFASQQSTFTLDGEHLRGRLRAL